jgi:hypothetical protein
VLIRSGFGRWGGAQLNVSPGHFSVQVLQTVARFLEFTADLATVDYWNLVNDGVPLGYPAVKDSVSPPPPQR